jgi:hypothetical protein
MKTEITEAISQIVTIELRYSGYSRTVEPHAYGRDKSGEEILRCFQVAGGSESGEGTGWKLLKVADAYAIQKTKSKFSPRPEYRRNDRAMQFMFCQL